MKGGCLVGEYEFVEPVICSLLELLHVVIIKQDDKNSDSLQVMQGVQCERSDSLTAATVT